MQVNIAGLLFGCLMLASNTPRILVHGHRGARAVRPENTLPAFSYAIAAGADVLELDMDVTKDDAVVISHDQQINRQICQGPAGETVIRRLTLEQVRQFDCGSLPNPAFPRQERVPGTKIPTLDEVFDLAAPSRVEFNIETKSDQHQPELAPDPARFAALVLAVIRKHRMESRVILQSFDFRTLREMRALAPGIRLSALYAGLPRSFVSIAADAAKAEIVSPMFALVTPENVKEAHAAGIQVVPWTANAPEDWDRLIAAQVDAIITDDPAALIEHLKAKGLR